MSSPPKSDGEIVKVNPFNMNNKLITEDEVINLLERFGVEDEIDNLNIYQQSFIHKSYIKKENNINNQGEEVELAERPPGCLELQEASNERLEYLGDSILGATIASYLYERFPDEDASKTPKWDTEPQEPVAALNSTAALLDIDPPDAEAKVTAFLA